MDLDDILKDVNRAYVTKKEVKIYRHEDKGKIIFKIEIDDPETEATFQQRLDRLRRHFGGIRLVAEP